MTPSHPARGIVGVAPGQPDAVALQATVSASHFAAELVCAWVDAGRYMVSEHLDGSMSTLSFDPDNTDLADDPALALGHIAETLGASVIIVGTRESGTRGGLQAIFTGSIAVRLAHRRHRPVVMIPLAPVSFDERLPWEPG